MFIYFSLLLSSFVTDPTVLHVEPNTTIEVEASATDDKGALFASKNSFTSSDNGLIDVSSLISLLENENPSTSFSKPKQSFEVTFSTKSNSYTFARELSSPEIVCTNIENPSLKGTLILPKSEGTFPVVVLLSGSNGGRNETTAKILASKGFATIALAYFGEDGLPPRLENIPLEYFETLFDFVYDHPNCDQTKLSLIGSSRGAELALILGSYFPDKMHAIVAISPSHVVYSAPSSGSTSAWTYKGKPIKPHVMPIEGAKTSPLKTTPWFIDAMEMYPDRFEKARIEVEKITCPILLIVGEQDGMWPSNIHAQKISERASSPLILLSYPNNGHGFTIPHLPIPSPLYYHPKAKEWFDLGGSREAEALSSLDAWNTIYTFLKQ